MELRSMAIRIAATFIHTLLSYASKYPNGDNLHSMVLKSTISKSTIPKITSWFPFICDLGFRHLVVRCGVHTFLGMLLLGIVLFKSNQINEVADAGRASMTASLYNNFFKQYYYLHFVHFHYDLRFH